MVEYTTRRYKFRIYRTRPLEESVDEIHILDDTFKFDIRTLELQGRGTLDLRFRPVLSIPVKYNAERGIFEISTGGLPANAYVYAHYYGSTLPDETQPNDYPVALDSNHRLFVHDDVVEAIVTSIRDKLGSSVGPATATLYGADLTAIQSVSLDTGGRRLLEVYASTSTATTFHLDVSTDGTNWIEDYKTYSGVTEVKDTLWNGFRYVKLRSDAAGTSGDTVTLILSAK